MKHDARDENNDRYGNKTQGKRLDIRIVRIVHIINQAA